MDRSAIFFTLRVAIVIAATVYVGRQVKKPTRWVGRLIARLMNRSHAPLTDWALNHLEVSKDAAVLDVGCGGGRTIERLAGMAASAYGIDYSAGSVAASSAHNKRLVEQGRVVVKRASVSQLPFAGNSFELVIAVETQYYWPDVANDMREILRVLKPAGRLMVVAESYRGGRHDWYLGPVMRLLGSQRLSVEDHRALFEAAGYTQIEIFEQRSKGWLCAAGQKPPL
ncbi:MAG TPA: class I SAM-dependent methyltransferase [Terracidiphilus sp.]|nr:class I SAM-dependent methyltransferase [Terracidiphilus sp.]